MLLLQSLLLALLASALKAQPQGSGYATYPSNTESEYQHVSSRRTSPLMNWIRDLFNPASIDRQAGIGAALAVPLATSVATSGLAGVGSFAAAEAMSQSRVDTLSKSTKSVTDQLATQEAALQTSLTALSTTSGASSTLTLDNCKAVKGIAALTVPSALTVTGTDAAANVAGINLIIAYLDGVKLAAAMQAGTCP